VQQERTNSAGGQTSPPRGSALRHGLLACAAAVVALGLLTATLDDPGLTWDEPAYLHSARGDVRPRLHPTDPVDAYHSRCGVLPWLRRLWRSRNLSELRRHLSREEVLHAWDYNRYGPNFHPPLSGVLAIAGHLVTHSYLDELASWRFASALELSISVGLVCFVVARLSGGWAGVTAAAALLLMPRVFGHGHIFGTDIPTLFIWVLAALLFWRGLHSRLARAAFGIVCGLVFLTKMNACAVFLPIAIWTAYEALRAFGAQRGRTLLTVAFVTGSLIPLGFVYREVRRQAEAITIQTQRELLRRAAVRAGLPVDPAVLTTTDRNELHAAAQHMLVQLARVRGIEVAPEQLATAKLRGELAQALGVPELNLDSFLAYVWADRLAIPSRLPRVVLLVPTFVLVLWLLAVGRGRLRGGLAALEMILWGAALGPLVAIGLNPTWWYDSFTQLALYYLVTAGRQGALPDIEIFYLGKKYVYSLPWHNGFVLTAVTVPVPLLVWSVLGVAAGLRARSWRTPTCFFILHALTLPLLRMLPVPAHDGVRLMLPTFWFLAALCGIGLGGFCALLRRFEAGPLAFHGATALVSAVTLAPVAYQVWAIHPFELSYYNAAVGGLPGACRLGFETTYWYDAVTEEVLARMNDPKTGLPPGAVLHPPSPASNTPVFAELQAMGKLRSDIQLEAQPSGSFPYMHLLTHSAKSTVFTRLLYALTPVVEQRWRDVRLFSLYAPPAVADAFALTLLCRDLNSEGDRLDEEVLRIAQEEGAALPEAALIIVEHGPDGAAEAASHRRKAVRYLVGKLTRQRPDLERLLHLDPQALVRASQLLVRQASSKPEVLRQLVEYPGYPLDADLGGYLDAGDRPD